MIGNAAHTPRLWTPVLLIPVSESHEHRKRRVVASTPDPLRNLARTMHPDTRGDWLGKLVAEQFRAERLTLAGGRLEPGPTEAVRLRQGKCGTSVHAGSFGDATVHPLVGVHAAWWPITFTCGLCRGDCSAGFLVERDTAAGKWLNITNCTGGTFAPAIGGALRVTLAHLDTWSTPDFGATLADPHTHGGTVDDRYRTPAGSVVERIVGSERTALHLVSDSDG